MEKAFFKKKLSFDSDKSSTTEIRESAASFSGGNGWFASSWKFSPPSIFWNYTAWLACRLELLISDTSGFLKCKCRNCWRNLGFCLCAQTSPRGSRSSAAVRQELLFFPPSHFRLQLHEVIMFLSSCWNAPVFVPSPLNKWAPSNPCLYLPTATLSTRSASPPSTTKTCTTTRISGTCESS